MDWPIYTSYGVSSSGRQASNLLWTDKGVRIIDFNVAVSENDEVQGGGGTRRYLPPDYDYNCEPDASGSGWTVTSTP